MAASPYLGTVQAFGFPFAPKNWAQCNGQLIPIAQNQALFALLGTFYGGDGRTTFALPDLRGRAVRGYGQTPGLSPCPMGTVAGAEQVTLLATNLPLHNHMLTTTGAGPMVSDQPGQSPAPDNSNNVLGALNDPSLSATNNFYTSAAPNTNLNTGYGAPHLSNSGGSQPVDIMQPYLVVNYCIALSGYFPSRN